MPTEFRSVSVPFPAGAGTKQVFGEVVFNAPVVRAETALKGFSFDYTNKDHHINILEALTLIIAISGATVRVQVICLYADKNFDDPFKGMVDVLVLAEVAEVTPPT